MTSGRANANPRGPRLLRGKVGHRPSTHKGAHPTTGPRVTSPVRRTRTRPPLDSSLAGANSSSSTDERRGPMTATTEQRRPGRPRNPEAAPRPGIADLTALARPLGDRRAGTANVITHTRPRHPPHASLTARRRPGHRQARRRGAGNCPHVSRRCNDPKRREGASRVPAPRRASRRRRGRA